MPNQPMLAATASAEPKEVASTFGEMRLPRRWSAGSRLMRIMVWFPPGSRRCGQADGDRELGCELVERLHVDVVRLHLQALDGVPHARALLEDLLEALLEERQQHRAAGEQHVVDLAVEMVLEEVERQVEFVAEVLEHLRHGFLHGRELIARIALQRLRGLRLDAEAARDRLREL